MWHMSREANRQVCRSGDVLAHLKTERPTPLWQASLIMQRFVSVACVSMCNNHKKGCVSQLVELHQRVNTVYTTGNCVFSVSAAYVVHLMRVQRAPHCKRVILQRRCRNPPPNVFLLSSDSNRVPLKVCVWLLGRSCYCLPSSPLFSCDLVTSAGTENALQTPSVKCWGLPDPGCMWHGGATALPRSLCGCSGYTPTFDTLAPKHETKRAVHNSQPREISIP